MPAKKKGKKKAAKRASHTRGRAPSTSPAAPAAPPPETTPERKAGERVASVRSRRAAFNRAGLSFSADIPVTVREKEIGADRFERIINEPMLRCDIQ